MKYNLRIAIVSYLQRSAIPYLVALIAATMLGAYGNYLAPLATDDGIIFRGQSLGIAVPILLFPVSLIFWFIYQGKASRSWWLQIFLVALIASWIIHFAITRHHGDLYVHTVWLFVPIVLMVMVKSPTSAEAWQAIVVMAWIAAVIMLLTRALEMLNMIPQWFYPTPDQAQWEIERYWLPFAGQFGVASRWPGPFGFNSKTGFVAVFLVVVALARWRAISSSVFLTVGILGILLTGGRGVYLSALAGILTLALFSQWRLTSRIPSTARVAVLIGAAISVAYLFASSATGTTGRLGDGGIWDAFLDLWRSNPWLGVGRNGILNDPGRASDIMDAHSIFIQELAQFGNIGFTSTFLALAISVIAALLSASRNWAGPLALLTIYLVAGATDLLHSSWQVHSMHTLMIVLATASSSGWLLSQKFVAQPESPLRGSHAHGSAEPPA